MFETQGKLLQNEKWMKSNARQNEEAKVNLFRQCKVKHSWIPVNSFHLHVVQA